VNKADQYIRKNDVSYVHCVQIKQPLMLSCV